MPMLSAQQAGPLTSQGGRERGMGGMEPQEEATDPCPCCQGSGTVPAGTSIDDCIMQMQQQDMQTEEQQAPPSGGSPTPSASDLQSPQSSMSPERQQVRDYAKNRPSPFAHQPIDEDSVLSEGARIRKRMSTSGLRGGA